MPKLTDYLPGSGYLRADDLPENAAVRLVIDKINVETIQGDDGEQQKPVLYFVGREKGLVLNATNLKMLAALFGDDTTAIIHKEIVLFRTYVDFRGQTVPCLRLRGVENKVSEEEIPF